VSFLHRLGPAAAISATLLAVGVPSGTAAPAPPRLEQRPPEHTRTERPFLDVRVNTAAAPKRTTGAQEALRRSLGVHGVVDVDPLTGTLHRLLSITYACTRACSSWMRPI
jgi:hypothetical protein